jgi:hypothetical protein
MEIADIMDLIKIGRQITLIKNGDCGAWARNIDFKLHSYRQALQSDSSVAQWISLAQNVALSSHPYTLEDGPELPKVPGRHAEEGREVLEGGTLLAAHH